MKPQRASAFIDAVPVGRGHRRPETLAALNRRDELIREAVAVYFPGASANDAAHRLHTALQRYECGSWRRDVSRSLSVASRRTHRRPLLANSPRDRPHADATINPADPPYSLPMTALQCGPRNSEVTT